MGFEFEHLTGLIAAPLTPFRADGCVNLDAIDAYAHILFKNGIKGVFVNGTTGEGYSLTEEERMTLAEKWVDVAPKGLKVLIHVGYSGSEVAVRLSRHAQEIEAAGFGSICNTTFRPNSISQLVDQLIPIAKAAQNLPFYYYHIPSLTDKPFTMLPFLKEAEDKIPNLAGVKFTFENLMDFELCRQYKGGKFNMLFGRDEIYLAAVTMGAEGAIGSTYNIIPKLYLEIDKALRANNLQKAAELQRQSQHIIQCLIRTGKWSSTLKLLLKERGLAFGVVRSPQQNLTADEIEKFKSEWDGVKLSDYWLEV